MNIDERDKMLQELHDFWMKPAVEGQPSRARQIDDVLTAVRTGHLTVRALLWIAGTFVAMKLAWDHLLGILK